MRRVSQGRISAPVDFYIAARRAELERDYVRTVKVDNPAVSRSQPDFHDAPQVVSPVDLGFSAWREAERFMTSVALRYEWINRLILGTVAIVTADSILIIQRRRIVRVRKVRSGIDRIGVDDWRGAGCRRANVGQMHAFDFHQFANLNELSGEQSNAAARIGG